MKWYLVLLVGLLTFSLVSSIDNQLVTPGFGDIQISVSPNPANLQIYYFGKEYVSPNITLIAPFDNSEDSDGIVDFYYTVSDANQITNCSLFLDGNYQDSDTSINKSTQQHFQVVAPPVNERLEWLISCTDSFNNNGNSSTWHVKTQRGGSSEIGGGTGGVPINVTELEEVNITEIPDEEEKPKFPLGFFIILFLLISITAFLVYNKRKKILIFLKLIEEEKEEETTSKLED